MMEITIDNRKIAVEEGTTILQAARANGVDIPTLCFHPALKPSGSCKLCAVEVASASGREMTMLACVLKVREGIVIRTSGEVVEKVRRKAFRNLLRMAPESRRVRLLAEKYGVDLGPPPDGCIRCRLCIRVCKEVVGAEALRMEKRDDINYVTPISGQCIGCGTCANICPTDHIQLIDDANARTITIRDEVIGKHPLETCEGCGKRFATPRFLDYIESRTEPHPRVKEDHRYCPTCAKLFSNRVQSFTGSLKTRN